MSGKNSKENGKNRKNAKRGQSVQVRPRAPTYDKYQRFTKISGNNNGIKYGTILMIAVLAGLAAFLSPLGTAITSQFNYSGQSAADVWWIIAAIAVTLGGILAFADWYTRGKY